MSESKRWCKRRSQWRRLLMQRMSTKSCRFGSGPAQFSLAAVISTVGVSPRLQKCSSIVLLCDSCIRELCNRLAPVSSELQRALKDAYTALNSAGSELRDGKES